MKHESVMKVFEANYLDTISDNQQVLSNDFKDYSSLMEEAKADLLNFDPDEEEEGAEQESTQVNFQKHTRPKVPSKIPNYKENPRTKARMVSFQQIYDMFNLSLNKSFLRKRTRSAEQDIHKLQQEMAEQQNWREELEARLKEKFGNVEKTFEQHNKRNERQLRKSQEDYQHLSDRIKGLDMNLGRTRDEMEEHKKLTYEQQEKLAVLDGKVDGSLAQLSEKFEARFKKFAERQTANENETSTALSTLNATLDNLRAEMGSMVESRLDFLSKNIEKQTTRLKQTYEELNVAVAKKLSELDANFQDKVLTIKSMVAAFFEKTDRQLKGADVKAEGINKMMAEFEKSFINPNRQLDGKLFSINMKMQQEELQREGQFTFLKEAVVKLIHSLESQNWSVLQQQSLLNLMTQAQLSEHQRTLSSQELINQLPTNHNSAQGIADPFINMIPSVQQLQEMPAQLRREELAPKGSGQLHLPSILDKADEKESNEASRASLILNARNTPLRIERLQSRTLPEQPSGAPYSQSSFQDPSKYLSDAMMEQETQSILQ